MPIVAAIAGLMFATSAGAARGSDLRGSGVEDLPDVIRTQTRLVETKALRTEQLRADVEAQTAALASADPQIAQQTARAATWGAAAGTEPVSGPAVTVALTDANTGGRIPPGYTVDDVVVHQQDVQAVVNALWAAGAEAMTIQDQRVVATSAVRCVGNTLILQGRVYSPPYVITAIGDPQRLLAGLEADPTVANYRRYVDLVGLGYRVTQPGTVSMPGFTAGVSPRFARADG
ncbi:hypothetical protein KILIM_019_00320 [Kineosphaera limosa NBRC 100340]|uniref:DUF881 domain-containing protein n=1 Tax=Kineosphaera limosa NBRC 100340 TaxID=1184609 RepID=K6W868_9MICO|nr:hypothetical protein KILIM_019_00320 [Kineosphaera limosa NBRC 100340]